MIVAYGLRVLRYELRVEVRHMPISTPSTITWSVWVDMLRVYLHMHSSMARLGLSITH